MQYGSIALIIYVKFAAEMKPKSYAKQKTESILHI